MALIRLWIRDLIRDEQWGQEEADGPGRINTFWIT